MELWLIFCGDAVKLEKKKNEDGLCLDAVEEYEFRRMLERLAPLELEFYGE